MPIDIKRRDFINGAVIGAGGLLLTGCGKEVVTEIPVTADALGSLAPQIPLRITRPHSRVCEEAMKALLRWPTNWLGGATNLHATKH